MAFDMLGTFGDGSVALNPTVIANEFFESASLKTTHKALATNRQHSAAGMTIELPSIDALTFAAHTEGDAVTPGTVDIDAQSATVLAYVSDYTLSDRVIQFSAADATRAVIDEFSTAYAKQVDSLIETAIEAATGNDVDHEGTMTIDHAAEAYANLVADGAPGPYFMCLAPSDWSSMYASSGVLVSAGNESPLMAGPTGGHFVGNIAGFQTYVAPYSTKTHFYAKRGAEWIWKPVNLPGDSSGTELNVGVEWRPEYRGINLYSTFYGVAVARSINGTAGAWVGTIYNAE